MSEAPSPNLGSSSSGICLMASLSTQGRVGWELGSPARVLSGLQRPRGLAYLGQQGAPFPLSHPPCQEKKPSARTLGQVLALWCDRAPGLLCELWSPGSGEL